MQPFSLLAPPSHLRLAKEVGGLVELIPRRALIAFPVEALGVKVVRPNLFQILENTRRDLALEKLGVASWRLAANQNLVRYREYI